MVLVRDNMEWDKKAAAAGWRRDKIKSDLEGIIDKIF